MAVEQLDFIDDSEPQVGAVYLNSVKREINNTIKPFVELLSDSNNEQFIESLLKACLGSLVCSLDITSTSTQYNLKFKTPYLNILPASFNYFDGMLLWIDNTIENIGVSQLNLLNKGSIAIKNYNGSDLSAGDLPIGLIPLMYDESLNCFKKYNIV